MNTSKIAKYAVGLALLIFALATLSISSAVLFDWFKMQDKQGDYVPFIVGVNFICGLLYLAAGYGVLRLKRWSMIILIGVLIILFSAQIALALHIDSGGKFEFKTIGAMIVRFLSTLGFLILTYFILKRKT